jgi:hypothetical protein
MVKGAVLLAVVVICGGVSSCAGDPPPRPSVESFCDGACQGAARCGSSYQACYSGCVSDPGNASLGSTRPEAAEVVGDCLTTLDCQTIFNGPYDACWAKARAQTAPSDHLVAFCAPYSTNAFECGYWFSVEDCQTKLNIWTDKFLDRLAACTQMASCADTDACLEATFGSN